MAYTYGTEEWENAYKEEVNKRLESEPEPYIIATPEWVDKFEKAIQGDALYKEQAKTWEGSVVLQIMGKPEIGLDEDIFMYLDLWHGDCRFVRLVPRDVGENGDYLITGEYDRWKAVIKGELDVVKGMMQGKLKLKGDLPTIVRYVKAATRLVELSTSFEGKFPDEMSEDEVEALRSYINNTRDEFGI